MNVQPIDTTEYTDFNFNVHTVRHTVLSTDDDTQSLKDTIMEDLYRIFTSKN